VPSSSDLQKAKKYLSECQALCVLTGAGISAESGLRTFRDAGGLWEDHPVEQVATPQAFQADPEKVWRFYNARRKHADVATPNPAHIALARMELGFQRRQKMKPSLGHEGSNGNGHGAEKKKRPPMSILTQNIDGLHQQAGSQRVIELHGSVWKVRCTQCGETSADFPIEVSFPPLCVRCDGLLRPHVIWFGEVLEEDVLEEAERAVAFCDLFMVIGTSALVQPAASYPFAAARRHVPVIEVNTERTAVSEVATLVLSGKAGEILPKVVPD
jgi:NAD-dependent deacetylase